MRKPKTSKSNIIIITITLCMSNKVVLTENRNVELSKTE